MAEVKITGSSRHDLRGTSVAALAIGVLVMGATATCSRKAPSSSGVPLPTDGPYSTGAPSSEGDRPGSSVRPTTTTPPGTTTQSTRASSPEAGPGQLCLAGTFTTVFGGPGQVYFLTDDAGQRAEIVLDPGVADPVGGPLALDRRRVTIEGEALEPSAAGLPKVRATSIILGEGKC